MPRRRRTPPLIALGALAIAIAIVIATHSALTNLGLLDKLLGGLFALRIRDKWLAGLRGNAIATPLLTIGAALVVVGLLNRSKR